MKLHDFGVNENGQRTLVFHCPGCGYSHPFSVPRWEWNGSLDKPTFAPSLLVNQHDDSQRCHSFVRGGKIEFLSDCFHSLAGQTVEIPEWEDQ